MHNGDLPGRRRPGSARPRQRPPCPGQALGGPTGSGGAAGGTRQLRPAGAPRRDGAGGALLPPGSYKYRSRGTSAPSGTVRSVVQAAAWEAAPPPPLRPPPPAHVRLGGAGPAARARVPPVTEGK